MNRINLKKADHFFFVTAFTTCSAREGMASGMPASFSRVAPLGDLVGPGGAELRPAQAFGVFRGKSFRHRTVRPFDAPARRNPDRALAPVVRGKETGDAFDHHLAHVMLALADERDAADRPVGVFPIAEREPPHPFGAGARLASAAAAED
jgi:hypothetical protein